MDDPVPPSSASSLYTTDVGRTPGVSPIAGEPQGTPQGFNLDQSQEAGETSSPSIFSAAAGSPAQIPTQESVTKSLLNAPQSIAQQTTALEQQLQGQSPQFLERLGNSSYAQQAEAHLQRLYENLGVISKRLNFPAPEKPALSSGDQKVLSLFNYLTGVQNSLGNLGSQLGNMPPDKINPQTLFLIQSKVNALNMQMSFFTNALNQGISAIKNIMNIQV